MQGGPGLDQMNGGSGEDVVFGGFEDDFLIAGNGNDELYGEMPTMFCKVGLAQTISTVEVGLIS